MATRPKKGNWVMYVSVPSRRQAGKDAKRARKWCDKTKIVEKNGWFQVWMLNPSKGATLILGL